MTRRVYIRTFGCQMNEYDSDKMADVLAAADGYELAAAPEDAELILLNTCSVRGEAQEKVFNALDTVRHPTRVNPHLLTKTTSRRPSLAVKGTGRGSR